MDSFNATEEDGRIVLCPVRPGRADEVRKKLEGAGITEADVKRRRGVGAAKAAAGLVEAAQMKLDGYAIRIELLPRGEGGFW